MKTIYKNFVMCLLVIGVLAATATPTRACDRSRLTLDSVTPGPSGSYYIYLRLCVGAGTLGLVQGADGNTGRFLFSFSSSTPGFSVMSFTSPITSDFTGVPYNGVNVGAQPAFNAQQAIFYNNTSNWFACITNTVSCGTVNTECDQVRFQVNSLPDSIRIYGIEGGDNLFGGCYPNVSMLIDFTNLPVEWQDFHCRQTGAGVAVDWSTMNEYNNSHFEVTRSADGVLFETIGTVNAESNSNKVGSYNFLDPNPNAGVNHYRIRQVDFDGASSESQPVSIFYSPISGLGWESVSPIPAEDYVTMVYRAEKSEPINFEMTDMQGRIIQATKYAGQIGLNEIQLDVRNLAKGIYYLRLSNLAGMLEKKIVVM